jgi:hypothetical protein
MNLLRNPRARRILAGLLILFGTPSAGMAQACKGVCLYEFGYVEWSGLTPYVYSDCTVTWLNGEAAIICVYQSLW